MRLFARIAAIPLLAAALCLFMATAAAAGRPPHFDYPTKLLNVETAYVLGPGGHRQIGLGESGLGFNDRFQITTNTLLDVLSFININAKVALTLEEGNIPQIAVGGGYYNLLASNFYIRRIAENALSTEDDELSIDSGVSSFRMFASISKQLKETIRGHISYQFNHISGYFDSDEPILLSSGSDELAVYASLDQSVGHHSVMAAVDADATDRLKLMFELGFDATYEKIRGGFGLRIGATDHLAIQAGILFPGIDLEDDFSMPVLPNFGFFWRF